MFTDGVLTKESVDNLLKEKNADLKLFAKIQDLCGIPRKSEAGLSLLQVWRGWNFSDEMILEGAKRATGTASPIPYINKILAGWKEEGVFTVGAIKDTTPSATSKPVFVNPTVQAINAKADRENFYAKRKAQAEAVADKYLQRAMQDKEFAQVTTAIARMQLDLAKAEVYGDATLPKLQAEEKALIEIKTEEILKRDKQKTAQVIGKFEILLSKRLLFSGNLYKL
jgi:hypothetical protein